MKITFSIDTTGMVIGGKARMSKQPKVANARMQTKKQESQNDTEINL